MSVANTLLETRHGAATRVVNTMALSVATDMATIETHWRAIEAENTSFIYQSFDWMRIIYETVEAENQPLIVHGSTACGMSFVLPLVVTRRGVTTVRWPGGKYANICCGLYNKRFLENVDANMMRDIVVFIRKQVSGVSLLRLNSQPKHLRGFQNPMMLLPTQASQNIMYELSISDGIDAVLDAGNGKRKRKIFRKQVREAEQLGGYELASPETDDEIKAALADFLEQKSRRFAELGVKDVFSSEAARAMITSLALKQTNDGGRLLRVFELKVGGKTRAMYGCGAIGDYCQAWVNSVTYDDFSDHSPGEMVLYLMIEQLVAEGFSRLDLGVGSERYKQSWCQSGQQLFDVIMPLSPAAYPVVAGDKAFQAVKAHLRNNESFWARYKKLRKISARWTGLSL